MSTIHKHRVSVAGAVFSLFLAAMPARAEVTQNDLQIAGRALSFLKVPLTGERRIGIVYVPGNAQSEREAATLQRLLGTGLKIGNITLRPTMVPAADAARSSVDLFFLTPGMGADAPGLAAASGTRRVPCVTTDLAQVRNGLCSMGVRSQPRIEILVNRAAAASSNTVFSSVFRMMITEI